MVVKIAAAWPEFSMTCPQNHTSRTHHCRGNYVPPSATDDTAKLVVADEHQSATIHSCSLLIKLGISECNI